MRKKLPFISFFILILLVAAAWMAIQVDFDPPSIIFIKEPHFLTREKEITFNLEDTKSGIKNFQVILRQGEQEKNILIDGFPKKGIHQKEIKISLKPRSLGFKEGKAILTITALDFSFFKNEARLERDVIIDTRPPKLELASLRHYINIGGSCLVAYHISKDAKISGALVGDIFFPGYPLLPDGPNVVYFALPWDSTPNTTIMIEAHDEAGNMSKLSFPYLIIEKKFRSDKINISDNFLNRKMPEFSIRYEDLSGSPLEIYLEVNNKLREKNHQKIKKICSKSSSERLWEGNFFRMKGSPRSLYADQRTYYYKGKIVDNQVHLGIDIAALKHFPVGAGNRGIAIFSEYLGIYGNTVIIDHGQNLFSIYSHLSSFKVSLGDEVNKGEIIGYTGTSGLAGGDHLHFGIMIGGMPVNPIEWWDSHWVEDNINSKLRPFLRDRASSRS